MSETSDRIYKSAKESDDFFGPPKGMTDSKGYAAYKKKVSSPAKSKALEKKVSQEELNKAVDKKYAKINASKGLTPSGKRKWHYYNSVVK